MLWLGLALAADAAAAQHALSTFDIPAQPLRRSLLDFGRQSRVQILFPDELVGERAAPAISGDLENEEALRRLLAGSGLSFEFDQPNFARLFIATQPATQTEAARPNP